MFKRTTRALLLSASLLVGTAQAQECSSLTITTRPSTSGTLIELALTGAQASSLTVLAISDTLGSTTYDLGALGRFTLGLDSVFAALPLSATDGNGDLNLSFDVRGSIGLELQTQALTAEFLPAVAGPGGFPFTFNFCTSNVEELTLL